jgi:hypothetical protein
MQSTASCHNEPIYSVLAHAAVARWSFPQRWVGWNLEQDLLTDDQKRKQAHSTLSKITRPPNAEEPLQAGVE